MGVDLLTSLRQDRLLGIIRGTDRDASVRAALTLIDAGIRHVEVALTTTDALAVIETVAREAPADARIGAGTVLTADDVHRVRDAGASFAVTPAVVSSIAECARIGFPVLAGAMTATEVITAMEQGATAVKLFPASVGGPSYLKALRDPLPTVPLLAVGGVGLDQAAGYLAAGAVALGLGGPLVGDAGEGGSLDALRDRAARFRDTVAPWLTK
jgi:2-dehydro-3-deoxyphosphogluconate aldolase/(4S)-4-hydroxy-2-oxoglutarate aldolase